MINAEMTRTDSDPALWNKLTEGSKFSFSFEFSEKDMDTFGVLSSDQSLVHENSAFAQANGFKGRVVYGALLVAMISRFWGKEMPGVCWLEHSLSLRFIHPLYANEKAQLQTTVIYSNSDLGVLRVRFEFFRDSLLIAEGQGQAGLLKKAQI